ncbi:MAG: hypothetical protein VKJ06_08185 [Vampirovibrionales bacterium]|nr:hypothetical protein [Vampirovibrionales bacterium]
MKFRKLGQKLTLFFDQEFKLSNLLKIESEIESALAPYGQKGSVAIDLNSADTVDSDSIRLIGSLASWCNQQGHPLSVNCARPKLLNDLLISNVQQLCRIQPFESGCPQT